MIFSSIQSIAKVVGLFFAAPLITVAPPELKLNRIRSIPLVLLLMFIQWQLILKLLVFYAYTFIVYAIFQHLFLTLIPKFCAQTIEKPKKN